MGKTYSKDLTSTLTFRLSERQLARIERAAKRKKCDRAELLRRLIDGAISNRGKLLLPEREEGPRKPGWRDEVRAMIREELAEWETA